MHPPSRGRLLMTLAHLAVVSRRPGLSRGGLDGVAMKLDEVFEAVDSPVVLIGRALARPSTAVWGRRRVRTSDLSPVARGMALVRASVSTTPGEGRSVHFPGATFMPALAPAGHYSWVDARV